MLPALLISVTRFFAQALLRREVSRRPQAARTMKGAGKKIILPVANKDSQNLQFAIYRLREQKYRY